MLNNMAVLSFYILIPLVYTVGMGLAPIRFPGTMCRMGASPIPTVRRVVQSVVGQSAVSYVERC